LVCSEMIPILCKRAERRHCYVRVDCFVSEMIVFPASTPKGLSTDSTL